MADPSETEAPGTGAETGLGAAPPRPAEAGNGRPHPTDIRKVIPKLLTTGLQNIIRN